MPLPFPVTKNITLLGSELFNLYLVKGETYALVEGGVGGITYPFLEQLSQLNVPPEALSHLIILHSHFDHMMVFPTLKGRYPWMKIVSSELNRATFSSDRIIAKFFDSDCKITLALKERGMISEAPNLHPFTFFPLDITIQEGSTLDLRHAGAHAAANNFALEMCRADRQHVRRVGKINRLGCHFTRLHTGMFAGVRTSQFIRKHTVALAGFAMTGCAVRLIQLLTLR